MPIYVQGPQGIIEFPDGMHLKDIETELNRAYPPNYDNQPLLPALGRGALNLYHDAAAGIAGGVGIAAHGISGLLRDPTFGFPEIPKDNPISIIGDLGKQAEAAHNAQIQGPQGLLDTVARIGGSLVPALAAPEAAPAYFGAQGIGEYKEAQQKLGLPDTPMRSAMGVGAGVLQGELAHLPGVKWAEGLIPDLGSATSTALAKYGAGAVGAGATGAAMGLGQNLAEMGGLDPNKNIMDGVGEQAATMALFHAGLGVSSIPGKIRDAAWKARQSKLAAEAPTEAPQGAGSIPPVGGSTGLEASPEASGSDLAPIIPPTLPGDSHDLLKAEEAKGMPETMLRILTGEDEGEGNGAAPSGRAGVDGTAPVEEAPTRSPAQPPLTSPDIPTQAPSGYSFTPPPPPPKFVPSVEEPFPGDLPPSSSAPEAVSPIPPLGGELAPPPPVPSTLDDAIEVLKGNSPAKLGPSLATFIAGNGGIRDDGGELESMNANGNRKGAARVIKSGGLSLERAAELAQDAGYLQNISSDLYPASAAGNGYDLAPRTAGPEDILEAFRQESAGKKIYAGAAAQRASDLQGHADDIQRQLGEMGLDHTKMSPEEIKQALQGPDHLDEYHPDDHPDDHLSPSSDYHPTDDDREWEEAYGASPNGKGEEPVEPTAALPDVRSQDATSSPAKPTFGYDYPEKRTEADSPAINPPPDRATILRVGKRLVAELNKMGMKDVGLRLEAHLASMSGDPNVEAVGRYEPEKHLIRLAHNIWRPHMNERQLGDAMSSVMHHEVIHALKNMGAFKPEEWLALERAAEKRTNSEGKTYGDHARELYDDLPPEAQREEAVAEMYREWNDAGRRVKDGPTGLLNRMYNHLRAIVKAWGASGADKVMHQIDQGKIGRRGWDGGGQGGDPKDMVAYHGTPHDFDRFSSDYIGAGEGHQAYGHGLYFAGKKAVSEAYRKNLAGDQYTTDDYKEYFRPGRVIGGKGHYDEVISFNENDPRGIGGWSVTVRRVDGDGNPLPGWDGAPRTHSTGPDNMDMKGYLGRDPKPAGKLFHVDIPEDHEYLDYDKPLSEQSDKVREALEKIPAFHDIRDEHNNRMKYAKASIEMDKTGEVVNRYRPWDLEEYNPKGKELYEDLANHIDEPKKIGAKTFYNRSPKAASKALMEAGIPGLRYLDQGSRLTFGQKEELRHKIDALTQRVEHARNSMLMSNPLRDRDLIRRLKGSMETTKSQIEELKEKLAGTHNYVIFDDSKIKVLHKEQRNKVVPFGEPEANKFIDFNKQIKDHPKYIQDRVKAVLDKLDPNNIKSKDYKTLTGEDFYNIVKNAHETGELPYKPFNGDIYTGPEDATNDYLKDHGIEGRHYTSELGKQRGWGYNQTERFGDRLTPSDSSAKEARQKATSTADSFPGSPSPSFRDQMRDKMILGYTLLPDESIRAMKAVVDKTPLRFTGLNSSGLATLMRDGYVTFSDRYYEIGKLVKAIHDNGEKITDISNDPYAALALTPQRIQAQVMGARRGIFNPLRKAVYGLDFARDKIGDLAKSLGKDSVVASLIRGGAKAQTALVEAYSYAMHAMEANARGRDPLKAFKLDENQNRVPNDATSGMTDEEAQKILDWVSKLPAHMQERLKAAHQRIMDALEQMRQNDIRTGLSPDYKALLTALKAERQRLQDIISDPKSLRDQVDKAKVRAARVERAINLIPDFKYYIPLKTSSEALKAMVDKKGRPIEGWGSGINKQGAIRVKGKESMDRMGRQSYAGSVLGNVQTMFENSLSRGAQNENAQLLARVLRENRNDPYVKEHFNIPTHPRDWSPFMIDGKDANGRHILTRDPDIRDSPSVFVYKVNGVENYIKMKSVEMAEAINGSMANSQNKFFHMSQFLSNINNAAPWIGAFGRFFQHINAGASLNFPLPLLFKHTELAMRNSKAYDPRAAMMILKKTPVIFANLMRNDPATMADLARLKEIGGVMQPYDTGGVESHTTAMNTLVHETPWSELKPSEYMAKVGDYWQHLEGVLSGFTNRAEWTTRLAVNETFRELGLSEKEGAQIAQELTGNFARRGIASNDLSKLYPFFNAGVQSDNATLRSLLIGKGINSMKAVTIRLMVGGFMLGALNDWLSPKDKQGNKYYWQVSEGTKDRDRVFMVPGTQGGMLRVPTPFKVMTIPMNLGRRMYEALSGHISPGELMLNTLGDIASGGNHFGDEASGISSLVPAIGRPIEQVIMNKDWQGNPIYPNPTGYGVEKPSTLNHNKNTNPVAVAAGQAANRLTGGDGHYTPGWADKMAGLANPDALQYMFGYYTGGFGHVLDQAMSVTGKSLMPNQAAIAERPLRPTEIPFAGRFMGQVSYSDTYNAYQEKVAPIIRAQKIVGDMNKASDLDGAAAYYKANGHELALYPRIAAIESRIKSNDKMIKQVQGYKPPTDGVPWSMSDRAARVTARRSENEDLMRQGIQVAHGNSYHLDHLEPAQ